ncbi:hypothetical protein MOO44_02505 [Nicoliella spurrieriana]|uniref:Uncharacterized protein n=1 Tax=Nicoliella spurrieriana TaxID=2925830 RepID=A0A976RSG7_9LACO|nr:hypothetical protein [Nicoliella spurrieriana]UQS87057.1 hypothetical protein MOO44_02505 [Nicoliella spurrieriana]
MRDNFIYIDANLVRNMTITRGIDSADFINGINPVPSNIILLNDDRDNANSYNAHTRFSTITGSSAVRDYLLDKQIIDKKIIDFRSNDDLNVMLDSEIANLLYLGHMTYPIANPFSSKIRNNYIYIALKSNFLKLFYRNFSTFDNVLAISIKRHLREIHSGRRMFVKPLVIKNIDDKILQLMIRLSSEGLVIAFDRSTEQKRQYIIPLLMEKYPEKQSTWYTKHDIYQNAISVGTLSYLIYEQQWRININEDKLPNNFIFED